MGLTPTYSTHAVCSHIFHSHIFHPAIYSCIFYPCIFHPCNYACAAFSTPAFSVAPSLRECETHTLDTYPHETCQTKSRNQKCAKTQVRPFRIACKNFLRLNPHQLQRDYRRGKESQLVYSSTFTTGCRSSK